MWAQHSFLLQITRLTDRQTHRQTEFCG